MKRTLTRAALLSAFLPILFLPLTPAGAGAQATWEIGAEPTLVIGGLSGPFTAVFEDIRGVMTVEDTLIVVADAGAGDLRVFTEAGMEARAFRGEGHGTEEFHRIEWAKRCDGSSIVVFDPARQRVTRWDAQGTLLDDLHVESPSPERPATSLSCGPGGRFAVVGGFYALNREVEEGPYRPEVEVGILSPDGRLERVLGTFPGPERHRFSNATMMDGPRVMGKPTIARIGPRDAFVGVAETYEIKVFPEDGERFTLGFPDQRQETTPEVRQAWEDSTLAHLPEQHREEAREALEELQIPDIVPAYVDFRFDELGLLWVELFRPTGQEWVDWDVWDVSGSGGTHVASLRVPRHFQPTEFGADYLLGVSRDTQGIQSVQRYRLWR